MNLPYFLAANNKKRLRVVRSKSNNKVICSSKHFRRNFIQLIPLTKEGTDTPKNSKLGIEVKWKNPYEFDCKE